MVEDEGGKEDQMPVLSDAIVDGLDHEHGYEGYDNEAESLQILLHLICQLWRLLLHILSDNGASILVLLLCIWII